MMILQIIGGVLLAAAGGCAIRAWLLDRRMQAFRTSDRSVLWYLSLPHRWQHSLYALEAYPMIDAAWKMSEAAIALGLLGGLLLAAAAG
jgi:hypothetical protein